MSVYVWRLCLDMYANVIRAANVTFASLHGLSSLVDLGYEIDGHLFSRTG